MKGFRTSLTFFQSEAAVAVAVGIGLLALPFLIQANDEDDEIPEIMAIYVANHGSTGSESRFSLSSSFTGQGRGTRLYERHDGPGFVERNRATR